MLYSARYSGSGYIAAFTGGMALGMMYKGKTHQRVLPAEGMAETLALLTWLVFGVMVISQTLD
jgi:hypothetical protein